MSWFFSKVSPEAEGEISLGPCTVFSQLFFYFPLYFFTAFFLFHSLLFISSLSKPSVYPTGGREAALWETSKHHGFWYFLVPFDILTSLPPLICMDTHTHTPHHIHRTNTHYVSHTTHSTHSTTYPTHHLHHTIYIMHKCAYTSYDVCIVQLRKLLFHLMHITMLRNILVTGIHQWTILKKIHPLWNLHSHGGGK